MDGRSSTHFLPEPKPWMDKLRVLQKLASDEGYSAKIFKAIADPPTTSLQRLKVSLWHLNNSSTKVAYMAPYKNSLKACKFTYLGLTTGGLPTFIDVGNSFGAPAIVEDNLIYQLAKNGKRVLMVGDDTWLQLFPDHFQRSFPFPSFNVKDLHTVDNGCIEHLLPALYQDDWDVLIAHFLGVDHAGHIFGVDSTPMIEKLEQYNGILEQVVEILKNQSSPGGLHENTFLLVMGDHGQTVNGDHGGGTAEEVETSLFAMSLRKPPASLLPELDSSSCKDLDGKRMCFSSIQQIDFAVTMAALLGIPFPFGSIGRVNPELYALTADTWSGLSPNAANIKHSDVELWMQNYVNVLCINCWQVKRYIDLYSASSIIGFSKEDLLHVEETYARAQANWSNCIKNTFSCEREISNKSCDSSPSSLLGQIGTYSNFLANVAELARSKWTEFDLWLMGVGLCILLASLFFHLYAIKRANKAFQVPFIGNSWISFRPISAFCLVTIRACSFLSNSYILSEGKVANFLLATTGILNLRDLIMEDKVPKEALVFLLLNFILGFNTESGLSKQAVGSVFTNISPSRILGIDEGHFILVLLLEIVPILGLILLAFVLYRSSVGNSSWQYLKYVFIIGTIISYMLIAVHWTIESNMLAVPLVFQGIGRNFVPRVVYTIGFGLALLAFMQGFYWKKSTLDYSGRTFIATVAILSAWSSTVLILLGRQGAFVALICIVGGWSIIRSGRLAQKQTSDGSLGVFISDPIPVTQWSLLAVCLFFYTGHWCTFDGLRYGAAFVGFDDFNLIRQGILLAIDTFGASHILPIVSLPSLVFFQYPYSGSSQGKKIFFLNLTQVYLIYGLITAITTMFTVISVTIQRRHLMVWGLFAPKFVFDVVGLILTDVLICSASLYYF